MNKNIKLAVAGAVLALSASAANAGVIIPAGEWTVDISGNVNSYAIWKKGSGTAMTNTGLIGNSRGATQAVQSTGLLPNFLSVAGSTRQNDLDVTFLISINPGSFAPTAASGGSDTEHRQADPGIQAYSDQYCSRRDLLRQSLLKSFADTAQTVV